MRMAAIMLLVLASLCAAAPFSANLDKSKIAKEASQEKTVAADHNVEVDLEVHYHGINMSDMNVNREGKFQVTFGDVEVLNSPFAVNFGSIKVTNTQGTDGGWSDWSEYSSCSTTCGSATKTRKRTCTEPAPANGGAQCSGPNQETVDCALPDCAIDGSWTEFSDWSVCSKTCGAGEKERYRTCTNPPPSFGGEDCLGQSQEVQSCVEVENCPLTCEGGATLASTNPGLDMAVCKDLTESTCERDFESLCPAGWNLCSPTQFNNRNTGWDYNWWEDYPQSGNPIGVIYCQIDNTAGHFGLQDGNRELALYQFPNCWSPSSRPGCEAFKDVKDCDEKYRSALCCLPISTCGDGVVDEEEDCDDGNDSNTDACLNSCTWLNPKDSGENWQWCT